MEFSLNGSRAYKKHITQDLHEFECWHAPFILSHGAPMVRELHWPFHMSLDSAAQCLDNSYLRR